MYFLHLRAKQKKKEEILFIGFNTKNNLFFTAKLTMKVIIQNKKINLSFYYFINQELKII